MADESLYQAPNGIEQYPYILPLATSMRRVLGSLFPLSPSCCICRVPKRLSRVSEKAYTPQVVSIGPLHHGKEGLKAMEELKHRYLQAFLHRYQTVTSLEDCIMKVKEEEQTLRSCYAEPIEYDSDEFVRIILVDAIFIIEVLIRYNDERLQPENDHIFKKPRMLEDVWPDLRMLENQLPFFILEKLFCPVATEEYSIISLSHKFFKTLMHIEEMEDTLPRIRSSPVEHFVDFVRKLYPLPPSRPALQNSHGGQVETLATLNMKELYLAGVRFKVGSSKNIFDIRFNDGTLEIPKITISDQSEVNLTNLLVFEQSQCKETENYINDYVGFLNILVNTPKDVALLVKHDIFENKLGDFKKGCTMIKNLGDRVNIVASKEFYYAHLREQLNKHCRRSWHVWKANLKQDYLNTPWATISVIAAVVLLILTLIQTVCSIISVRQTHQVS
ncbi:UPF0481 protein At3g47200-like [Rosa rugosa]|uniref:UPF0481 protein At3g47200-like n=1 Tax=Rosa rugosa TaxID=74645 RepID=UPI002B400EA2|nr:UPF0481 protein At3g47200-like [Rosa rugosa]XP_062019594.1 UPF0481 protein At3g47200-like [Rosa rugosa]